MKVTLLTGSIVGVIIFSLVFLTTFLSVDVVERSAKEFVVSRIEQEIAEREVAGIRLKSIEEKLSWLKGKYGDEIQSAKQQLARGSRIKIEEILEKICNVDCLRKKGITITTGTTDEYLQETISQLSDVSEKLRDLVKGKYYRIISELLGDLRIFSGINLLLFLSIAVILFAKTSAIKSLVLPAGLLFISTTASIAIYIFGQNWFYALMFSNYMGWGYCIYVGLIFSFLLDIVFNGASITSSIVESISSFLKSILECFPGA